MNNIVFACTCFQKYYHLKERNESEHVLEFLCEAKMFVLATLTLLCSITIAFSDCLFGICDPKETCCPALVIGGWTCCPYPNAICCADLEHCCPDGTVCSPDSQSCYPKMLPTVPNQLQKRQGDEYEEDKTITIPARFDFCSEETMCFNSTCCIQEGGDVFDERYGCCPFIDGECCADGKHCCEPTERCSQTSKFCIRRDYSIGPATTFVPAIFISIS
ncbi:hypothetical protein TNIN_25771 [Trichonephila inaurata madagascariensis]|uniref:Granulins domain-containing protein n=1 Tax=Trichonephila inaurata madagascariensis TaxID=2747483 RepID=A0A8X6YGE9_9ARAC|nr:hypothetical protein TNIN_25771 [Trichonephila inaurata madagascariensis]